MGTGCSQLAKSVLTTPTPYPVKQSSADNELDWMLYGSEATVAITRANDRAQTGYEIIAACEVRDQEVIDRMNRRFFGGF